MNFNSVPAGIAFTCDIRGTINNVLLDGIGIKSLAVSQPIDRIVDQGSQTKLLNFLVELRMKGVAINWEVNLLNGNEVEIIQLSGVSQKDLLMILGSHDAKDSLFMCGEFMKINNEQAFLLRAAIKDHIQSIEGEPSEKISIYDQISGLNNELINLQRDLIKKNFELEKLNRTIQTLAITDVLTGQNNRLGFFEKGEQQVAFAKRYNHPLTAIMIDVDKFKSINDTYGHSSGDKVLTELAARCHKELRMVDVFGRYGGDEFAILLPETPSASALIVAERIRLAVSRPFIFENISLNVTISLGIAELDLSSGDLERLLQYADRAMYTAKAAGRNRIFFDAGKS
jgi:diguanylate cyclase (GGDEF)-like protein